MIRSSSDIYGVLIMNKTFCEYFLKYSPKTDHKVFLDSITDWSVRVDKQSRRVEVRAELCRHIDQHVMIDIENEITSAYELLSTRIMPVYDPSLFSIDGVYAML